MEFVIDTEILTDLVDICRALIAITEHECCCYCFENEVEKAEFFVDAYNRYNEKETKDNDSNN